MFSAVLFQIGLKERSSDKFLRIQYPVILKNKLKSLIAFLSRSPYHTKDPLPQSFGVWKIEKYFPSISVINLSLSYGLFNLTKSKFEWADEYFAVSVSESNIEKVRNYISNQYEHHKKKSFTEEYNEFITKYGFKLLG